MWALGAMPCGALPCRPTYLPTVPHQRAASVYLSVCEPITQQRQDTRRGKATRADQSGPSLVVGMECVRAYLWRAETGSVCACWGSGRWRRGWSRHCWPERWGAAPGSRAESPAAEVRGHRGMIRGHRGMIRGHRGMIRGQRNDQRSEVIEELSEVRGIIRGQRNDQRSGQRS